MNSRRHGRACPDHPRLDCCTKVVDARHRRQVYAVCASLTALPGMTGNWRGDCNVNIKRVEAIAVSFPMKKPVFMAGVEIRAADNVLVRIEADNGVIGWGEAASAPTMTGETVESMMAAIGYLTPALEGRPAEDIAAALAAMAARMYANSGAKAAIEIALHDLVGRATNQP